MYSMNLFATRVFESNPAKKQTRIMRMYPSKMCLSKPKTDSKGNRAATGVATFMAITDALSMSVRMITTGKRKKIPPNNVVVMNPCFLEGDGWELEFMNQFFE